MEKLQDLTLLNKFLFDQTMDIPEAQEAALQIVLQAEKKGDLVMIMPFDLFGLGKYQYTFRTYCEEDKELIDFLHYVEKTDDKSVEAAGSERGMAEGIAKGKAEGKAESLLDVLLEIGEVSDELRDRILNQCDAEVLTKWFKVAIKVDNVEEFLSRI